VALVRYQKQSSCMALQSQAGRAALQWIADDLRLAGLNQNPEGDPNRATEAVEGMWDTAIALHRDEPIAWALGNVPAGGEPAHAWMVPIRDARLGSRPGPYTLYRMTLRPDGTGMTRQYRDVEGGDLAPAGGEETFTARAARGGIAAVAVELTVSTGGCAGRTESLTLQTLVRPRNSGLIGANEAGFVP
jgi:hypothetical protein